MPPETTDLTLDALLKLFPASALEHLSAELVSADDVPQPFRRLLVHHQHMTVTLEDEYQSTLELQILARKHNGTKYARLLRLTAGSDGPVVLVGIMRFHLEYCSSQVAAEIVRGTAPLGRILIDHDVMRSIECHAYLRFKLDDELRSLFALPADASASETYGRIARIICDGEPAVELLEIVAPAVTSESSSLL